MLHPLEIYSTTFSEVIEKTLALLEELEKISNSLPHLGNKDIGWEKRLASVTDSWLDSVVQHIDSCKGVLATFYSADQDKQKNKKISSFSKSIREYREQPATIVNYIKHKQRFLRVIYFYWIGGFVPGFFIEGVVSEGIIGPDPILHKHSNTAFSYNRIIHLYFSYVYFISSILANEIHSIINRSPDFKKVEHKHKDLELVFKRLSLSALMFFPDEAKKPVPLIKWNLNSKKDSATILLELPGNKVKPSTVPGQCRIDAECRIGEVYKTYKLPYFGSDIPVE